MKTLIMNLNLKIQMKMLINMLTTKNHNTIDRK